jgi:plasmid stability protein
MYRPSMKTIQIRHVPDDVHRELSARAAAAGRSLSDYLLEEVQRVAAHPPLADILRRADSRRGGVSPETVRAVLEEARAERERQLDDALGRGGAE